MTEEYLERKHDWPSNNLGDDHPIHHILDIALKAVELAIEMINDLDPEPTGFHEGSRLKDNCDSARLHLKDRYGS